MTEKSVSPVIDLTPNVLSPEASVEAPVAQTETAIPKGVGASERVENPYRIFISFFAGKKPATRILRVPFEDIETEAQLAAVLEYLQKDTGKSIEIINWRALEG